MVLLIVALLLGLVNVMGNTAPYYSLKNYTQVSGPNLAVIKVVVMVVLVVKEVVSK